MAQIIGTGLAIRTLSLLSMVAAGCNKNNQSRAVPKQDGRRSYEVFAATVESYPYDAPPERKAQIIAGYPRLEVGMDKDQVAKLIGEPDYSQHSYGPKGPNMPWKGSSWTYWLRMRDDGVNMKAPSVEIFFGTDDRAHWIVSTVDGLGEKGSPFRTATTQSNQPSL
jgi:hypothetical protein